MKQTRILVVIAVAYCLGLWPNTLATYGVAEDNSVELVSFSDYAPYISNDLPGGGIYTELIRAAYAHQGIRLKVKNLPWKRGYRLVQQGKAVGTYSWYRTEERDQLFTVSRPLFADAPEIFTTMAGIHSQEQLEEVLGTGQKAVVCVPLGWTVDPVFQKLIEKKQVTRIAPAKIGACFDLLAGGRAQLISISRLAGAFELRACRERAGDDINHLSDFHIVKSATEGLFTARILFARTDEGAEAAAAFDRGFGGIIKDGSYKAIVKKHLDLNPDIDQQQVFSDLEKLGLLNLD